MSNSKKPLLVLVVIFSFLTIIYLFIQFCIIPLNRTYNENNRTIDSLTIVNNDLIKTGDSLTLIKDSVLKKRDSLLKIRDQWVDSVNILVNSKGIISSRN